MKNIKPNQQAERLQPTKHHKLEQVKDEKDDKRDFHIRKMWDYYSV